MANLMCLLLVLLALCSLPVDSSSHEHNSKLQIELSYVVTWLLLGTSIAACIEHNYYKINGKASYIVNLNRNTAKIMHTSYNVWSCTYIT